jgi:hypothetical protein
VFINPKNGNSYTIKIIRERDGFIPDYIFITGDLAFSGKAQEYEIARHFLGKIKQIGANPQWH